MFKPSRLDAAALATELNKLPLLAAGSAKLLDPAYLAIARAVASGQSADELTQAFSLPLGWASLDIFKTPPSAAGVTDTTRTPALSEAASTLRSNETGTVTVAPVKPIRPIPPISPVQPVIPVMPVAPIAPPSWAVNLIPDVLKETTTTRIAVLDREPTALGGLEAPAWARALSPSAVYGPVTATSSGVQIQTPKWIVVFTFTETVQIVRGGTVLCVVPLSIFHLGTPQQATITAGSAWLAAHLFTTDAPADSFAGLKVSSGIISSTQPIVINAGVVTLPMIAVSLLCSFPAAGTRLSHDDTADVDDAVTGPRSRPASSHPLNPSMLGFTHDRCESSLSLSLVPAATPAGPAGFPSSVTAPGKITINFPAAGAANLSFDKCSANIWGEAFESAPLAPPVALYNTQLKLLYIAGKSAETTLTPGPNTGKLLTVTGSAPILTSGWALNVSESTTPAALGTAASSGSFAIGFGKGLSCVWPGATKPEAQAGGTLLAQNDEILFGSISGSAKGVLLKQNFKLWTDQDSKNDRPCQLLTGRAAGQGVLYATTANAEVLETSSASAGGRGRPAAAR